MRWSPCFSCYLKDGICYNTTMIKNPYTNALVAGGYIVSIVLFIGKGTKILSGSKETILIPMAMLSLLVFSVALMGVLFFYEPLRLFMENQRKEALSFFTKTLATFFCIMVTLFVLMFYSSYL